MTEEFEKQFHRIIPKLLRKSLWQRIHNLRNNPYVGKPLGRKEFRELKAEKFRIYFFVYEKKILVLMAGVSDKKGQKKTIDIIRKNKYLLDKFIKNLNLE